MKYPRTFHFPFSPGGTSDDKKLSQTDHLLNIDLVITEKLDGSNVCLSSEHCFARSHSGPPTHESFDGFKALHAQIKYQIPNSIAIYGEWCYAKHSIFYNNLPGYLFIFGIRDNDGVWYSWPDVEYITESLGLITVPVISKKNFTSTTELENYITKEGSKKSFYGDNREGIVTRKLSAFTDSEFSQSLAKFVRRDHVQTSEHWKNQKITKNLLVTQ